MTSTQFDVLVKGQEENLGWEWGSAPSDKAVKCDLEDSEGGDCFLGQGVYSDGICEEVSMIFHLALLVVWCTLVEALKSRLSFSF